MHWEGLPAFLLPWEQPGHIWPFFNVSEKMCRSGRLPAPGSCESLAKPWHTEQELQASCHQELAAELMGGMVRASGKVPYGSCLTVLAGDGPELMGCSSIIANRAGELLDMAPVSEAPLII